MADRTDEDIAREIVWDRPLHAPIGSSKFFGDLYEAVLSALRTARAEGEAAEREACAKIADAYADDQDKAVRATVIARAIRARSAPREEEG